MEQYANDIQTTLNGAINNSVTSIVVTSATGFPTTGNFAILIDTELMIVTAVAGTTWTVTRAAEGTTAASHTNLSAVISVLSKRALIQLVKDANQSGAFSTIFTPVQEGRLWFNTDIPILYRDTGSVLSPYGPLFPFVTPQTGWSWDNQGNATIDETSYGGISLQNPNPTNGQMHGRYRNAPTAPYIIDFFFLPRKPITSFWEFFFGWRDSSTNKLVVGGIAINSNFNAGYGGHHVFLGKWNSTTSFNSNYNSFGIVGTALSDCPKFFRIKDDNTNLSVYYSPDGINFTQIDTNRSRTNFLATPNQIFFGLQGNTQDMGMLILSQNIH
jgi:hypothetical protein